MTRIAVVGSGIVGTTIAYLLTTRGLAVEMFEKGSPYPYPHEPQFRHRHLYLDPHFDAPYTPPADLKSSTQAGLPYELEGERFMRVGGSATVWEAITIRMTPPDFKTRTLFGYGDDWLLDYDDLEPYYVQAERLMGVSGTDSDNPFAPPRSAPYPLPHFDLGYDDQIMAERLQAGGVVLHSTPQARTRNPYDGRPGCANFGTCRHCPIGVRYSPNHHLQQALATGLLTLHTDVSVRRLVADRYGKISGLVYRRHDEHADREAGFDIVIVAGGAVESARLLLLSDGIGGGQVGRGLAFHNVWSGRLRYNEDLYPFRFGGWTGQTMQFINAETRGQHGALKVEFGSRRAYAPQLTWGQAATQDGIREALRPQLQWRQIVLQTEAFSTPEKFVALSNRTDRYGDPFAHVQYALGDFDGATYQFARGVYDQFERLTGAVQGEFPSFDWYDSGSHHMGTCRMGSSADDSVVDSFGRVHDTRNLYVVGGSMFVGSGGASNPTLTMVALAIRSADHIAEQARGL